MKDYKKMIMELLKRIDNEKTLERIYNFIHKLFISDGL